MDNVTKIVLNGVQNSFSNWLKLRLIYTTNCNIYINSDNNIIVEIHNFDGQVYITDDHTLTHKDVEIYDSFKHLLTLIQLNEIN